MYVPSRQQVAVMGHPASGTRPTPVRQAQLIIDNTTNTRLRRRVETIDLMSHHTILRCDMLQLLHEIAMGKVADLPAPAAAHALEHQVLEDDGVSFDKMARNCLICIFHPWLLLREVSRHLAPVIGFHGNFSFPTSCHRQTKLSMNLPIALRLLPSVGAA